MTNIQDDEAASELITFRRLRFGPACFCTLAGTIFLPLTLLMSSPFSPFAPFICWIAITVGLIGMILAETSEAPTWVRHGEVPDDWQGRQVWHHVVGKNGSSLETWTRERFDPSTPADDVYFALADLPEPPQHGDQA